LTVDPVDEKLRRYK